MAYVNCECGFSKKDIPDVHIGKTKNCPKCGKEVTVNSSLFLTETKNEEAAPIPIQQPVSEISGNKNTAPRTMPEKIAAFGGIIFYLIALVCLGLWFFSNIPGMPICTLIAVAIGTSLTKKGKGKLLLNEDEQLIRKAKVFYERSFLGKEHKITNQYLGKVPTEMIITDKRIICDVADDVENLIFKYDEIFLHDHPKGFIIETKEGKKYPFNIAKEAERNALMTVIDKKIKELQ